MISNRKTAAALAGLMAASVCLSGCSGSKLDGSKTVATVGDETISLGVANFAAKITQAQYETYYSSYLASDGESMWDMSMNGDSTYEQAVKDYVIEYIEDNVVLRQHADEYGCALTDDEIALAKEYAQKFLDDNDAVAKERMTADLDTVTEYYELEAIYTKMHAAIIAQADTNVTDEEAAQKKVQYIIINTDSYTDDSGAVVEYTDEEKEDLKTLAESLVEKAKAGEDLATLADDNNFTSNEGTFGGDAITSVPQEVQDAVDSLKEGDVADLITADGFYYVAKLTSEFDEDATETQKESIIGQRQTDMYDDTLEEWKADLTITVDEKVWDKVKFDAPLNIVSSETDETEDTAVEEDDSEAEDATEDSVEEDTGSEDASETK